MMETGSEAPSRLAVRGMVGERQGRRLWGPLTFTLRAGQALHLQGPNGSGKTTLLRTLAGLRPPAAGELSLATPCWCLGHALPLADTLDAATLLRLWLQSAGEHLPDDATLRAALAGLPAARPVGEWSAGQRRRLALMPLSLAPRPLWLLDEPFDALDAAGQQQLAAQAAAHLAAGGALVLSAHQGLPAGFPLCTPLRLAGEAAPVL